jgi:hypothetical protein
MKKVFNKIWMMKALLIIGAVILLPHFALAAENLAVTLLSGATQPFINDVAAAFSYSILSLFAYAVSAAGTFLSVALNITIGLGDLYKSLPALGLVWVTIRNFASILIIFLLLYTSIKTILGSNTGNVKSLVASILIAGLLINFSLFFTKVLIDASNLVSLQFYKAMAPQAAANIGRANNGEIFTLNSAGLADTFLSVLQVQKVYGLKDVIRGENVKFNIFIATAMGSLIMITAAFSLFAAGIAFIARAGILLFIMAVSPLFVIAYAFPQYGKKGKQYMDLFKSQLIFMPVYLFLMYVALSFMASDEFRAIFNGRIAGDSVSGQLAEKGLTGYLAVIVQYVIALIFINIPLVTAIKMGAVGASWAPKANTISGWMTKKTFGNWASKADKYLENTTLGNMQGGRIIRSVTTGKLANAKLGTKTSAKEDEKTQKDIKKKQREIDNLKKLKLAIKDNKQDEIKKLLGSLSTNELANLDKDHLKDPNVIPHLSGAVYSSIEKSEKGDKDKIEISAARADTLDKLSGKVQDGSATNEDRSNFKNMMKNLKGEDLVELLTDSYNKNGKIVNDAYIAELKPSHIKQMEHLDDPIRHQIGARIVSWSATSAGGKHHPAFKEVNKNLDLWTP